MSTPDPLPTTAPAPDPGDPSTEAGGPGRDTAGGPPTVPGYAILEELGRGGMGVVYKALQLNLSRVVALKTILSAEHAGSRDLIRFLAEAEAVASVKHPNVVQVYDYGRHAGRPFFAMEYLPGGSLTDRLRSGPVRPEDATALLGKVARGVAAAHAAGIVHRDLKPANVLFDEAGEPKVTDFGLAKRGTGADLTGTNAVLGTPAYMAPEQAQGESKYAGPPVDVWALGVILYEALTGRRPFEGPDNWAVLQKVMASDPARPRSVNPAVPRDLELVCLKCLEKEPHERYPTANELADDLARFAAGESVTARRSGQWDRTWKWARRNRAVAGSLAAAAVALLVGTAASAALAVHAGRKARESDEARGAAVRAEGDATAARARAEANLREAVATNRSLVATADELRETLGNNTQVLSALLRQADENLARLQNAGDSPEVREQRAALKALTADLRLEQGRTDLALPAADEAVTEYEALLRAGTGSAEVRAGLWFAHFTRGRVHGTRGATRPALADFRRSVELADGLAAAEPGRPRWEFLRARGLSLVGQTLWQQGYFPEGDRAVEEAFRVYTRVAEAAPPPERRTYRRLLAQAHVTRGAMLARKEDPAAVGEYRTAHDQLRPLAAESASAQFNLAEACVNLAQYAQEDGDTRRTGELLDEAGRLCDGLLQADPGNGERRRLNQYYRLIRSQTLPTGADQHRLYRDQIALFEAMMPVCRRYIEADPDNAQWRGRLSLQQALRARNLAALHPGPTRAGLVRLDVRVSIALALADARRRTAADPDGLTAAQHQQTVTSLALQVEKWATGGSSAAAVREWARPVIEFYTRLAAAEPGRAEWRVGLAAARHSVASSLVAARHNAEAEAECTRALADLEAVGGAEGVLRRADLYYMLGTIRLNPPADGVPRPPASEALGRAVALLEPLTAARPSDALLLDKLASVSTALAAALRAEGKPVEADAVRAKVRTIRLRRVEDRVTRRDFLDPGPRTVSQAALRAGYYERQQKLAAEPVQLAEQLYRSDPSPDRAVEVAESYLSAAGYENPADPDYRKKVAGHLAKILDVYQKRSDGGRKPLLPDEERLAGAVRRALAELTAGQPETAPPPRPAR